MSFLPIAIANWSIIPQLTPLKLFSENCPIKASSWFDTPSPSISLRIYPVTTSTEADEESPEPFGIFPFNNISKPQLIL